MKNRLLGVVIMLIVTIPCLLIGGISFKILAILISILSLKEFLDVTKIPKLVKISSYLAMLFLYFNNLQLSNIKIISLMLLIFFIFIIYYHDNKKYNIMDAIYLVTSIFLIYIPCSYIIELRNTNINIFIYLILITTMTDTYAYITGYLIGKHKLIEEISPNKTIEGLIGGIFGGTFIPIIFYMVNFNSINVPLLILQTVVLSLLGQFGDLFFSSIKRQYKIKDFSNLIPGHGGILDRIDGLIFVVLGYLIFI